MSILIADYITKSYGEKVLFDKLSFTLGEQQRIGLIGVNGTGKSSLLKIIAGFETPDEGKITHSNAFRIEYLPQDPQFEHNRSVLDELFQGESPIISAMRLYERALLELLSDPANEKKQAKLMATQQTMDALRAWEANTEAKMILTSLGISDFSKPVGELSGGQRKRVALARALIHPADLLILDEPTNHIDNETVEWLEQYLSRYKGTLILVTHDRYFLDRVTNRIIELDNGMLYSYEGNYAVFLEKKADRLEREAASEDKRQNLLRRELAWLHRGAKARTTKQKARIQRVEELKSNKVQTNQEKMEISLGTNRLGKKVIEFKDVTKSFGGIPLIKDFSYIVLPDDRIGIVGRNGSGKSTFLNMIAGKIAPETGIIEIGPTVKIGFYTQENVDLNDNLRVIEYIKEAAEIIYTSDGHPITASQMLERFLFPPHAQWTPISRLSGGEKRRLYLLRILMTEPNVLLLDEPTNDLDIQTLTILEDFLENFPGAVITVSHDRYFLDRTAEHLFVFEQNGEIKNYFGNYSEYMDTIKQHKEIQEQELHSKAKANATKQEHKSTEKAKTLKLSYKEQKEWEQIEAIISDLEGKIEQNEAAIVLAGSDSMLVQQLFEEQQQLNETLEKTIERWTELSELVEEIERNKATK